MADDTRYRVRGAGTAGFNSNSFVKGRLQAALYHNRKRRLDRLNGNGNNVPIFGGGYQQSGANRLATDRAIHYRFQSTVRGYIVCIRALIDTDGVEVDVSGAIYLSSAQDLTGTPASQLRLSTPLTLNIPNGSPQWVELIFPNAPPIDIGTFAHMSVGTNNVASWGFQYDDNSGDDDQHRSTAVANTTLADPADITGPIDDTDMSAYILTRPDASATLFGSYGSAYGPSYD